MSAEEAPAEDAAPQPAAEPIRIRHTDRLPEWVVVEFTNGTLALFTSAFLFQHVADDAGEVRILDTDTPRSPFARQTDTFSGS